MKRSSITPFKFAGLVGVMFVALSTAAPQAAHADAALSIRIIRASNSGGGVDNSLRSMASQLQSRFSNYDTFEDRGRQSVSIAEGASQSISLPNGQTMTITLLGMSGSSYRLRVSLPGGGGTVTASPGGRFFVASGSLIIAIST
jgi:hypothetical protein